MAHFEGDRRRFLSVSALILGGTAAGALIPETANAQGANVAQDIAVLNYALTLERLEADFYVRGLQRFGASDFAGFGFAGLFDRLRDIRDHEVAHVAIIQGVVESLGGAPVMNGEFQFPYTDARSFLRVAQILENTGVSAYDGAVALLRTPQIQTASATIATVEARHAAYFARRPLRRRQMTRTVTCSILLILPSRRHPVESRPTGSSCRLSAVTSGASIDTQANFGISPAWMGAGIVGFELDFGVAPDFLDMGLDEDFTLIDDVSPAHDARYDSLCGSLDMI